MAEGMSLLSQVGLPGPAGATSMRPLDELKLYDTDYPVWLQYAAPRIAARLPYRHDALLAQQWSMLPRAAQVAVWEHLDEAQRGQVKASRAGAG